MRKVSWERGTEEAQNDSIESMVDVFDDSHHHESTYGSLQVAFKDKPFNISYICCLSVRPLVFVTSESGVVVLHMT